MMSVRWVRSIVLALGMSVGVVSVALAQPPAVPSQHAESVATRHSEDSVRLGVTAGTALTYGNARNFAVNLGGDFLLRLGQHALTAQIGWIYGMASLRDDDHVFGPWQEGTDNLTWKLRYDLFLTDDDALFAVHHGRRDPFAKLEPRIGFQVGYMRNFVNEEKHRFWGEIGYDFTYDRFGELLDVGDGQTSDDRALHSARLFIGYDNRLNDVLTYTTGLQALMRVDRPEHWRFEWTNQLRSKLADWLQVSLDVTGRLDSLPPGQAEAWNEQPMQATQMFDLITTLNLVGSFDLHSVPDEEEAEEEATCAPCPACPEPAPCAEPSAAEPSGEPIAEPAPAADAEAAAEPAAAEAAAEPAAAEAAAEPAADAPATPAE